MCGRFNLTDSPAIHTLLDELGIPVRDLPTRYNIAPTEPVMTIFHDEEQYLAMDMRWWLTPSWSEGPSQKFAMFNARAETVENSRAYKGPFRHHRAIIPATSFIEWKQEKDAKQPYELKPHEGCLFLAAIWDHWQDSALEVFSCAMMTTAATKALAHIHPRQPAMLSLEEAKQWLEPKQDTKTLKMLLEPHQPTPVEATPVSTAINNARNKNKPEVSGKTVTLG